MAAIGIISYMAWRIGVAQNITTLINCKQQPQTKPSSTANLITSTSKPAYFAQLPAQYAGLS